MENIPITYIRESKSGQKYYPKTSGEAVVLENGNTLEQEFPLYEKKEDLLNNMTLSVNDRNQLELKLGDSVLAYINKGLLVNILRSTNFDSETNNLTITFSNGDEITVNLIDLLGSFIESVQNDITKLQEQHVVMSEEAYSLLDSEEIDPDKFYYLYEDE